MKPQFRIRSRSLSSQPFVLRSSEMAGHKFAHATLKGPSVVKEILYGSVLVLACGSLWKMHHWNEQRKVRAFYDLLEKGEISVVVEE
ncbi:probable cytochrome c oxidase subunit 5C-3 [Malus domestica]|uniref:probable cytochrome c oxidase subunit 5C-3 n=1 Tax=Malus domestica TaxID=3750 RepID=UPI0004988633|nr:probable cytochrome c oxidase subunit 5C-3 [Malus domestica]